MVPTHLLKAREAVVEQISNDDSRNSHINCFDFVNRILKTTLSEPTLNELSELHNRVLLTLEPAHRYSEIIPYHYSLISSLLHHNKGSAKYWRNRSLFEAKPGDIFVYIDPNYDPDPHKRIPGQPSGTHVAFIDEIVESQTNEFIKMRIIDSSQRKKGRGYTQDYVKMTNHSRASREGIAYSTVTLRRTVSNKPQDKILWKCEILGQRKFLKYIFVLGVN